MQHNEGLSESITHACISGSPSLVLAIQLQITKGCLVKMASQHRRGCGFRVERVSLESVWCFKQDLERKNGGHEIGFKEGDCPGAFLNVEFLVDWFGCDKGKSVLEN